jgi:hypothetical protein
MMPTLAIMLLRFSAEALPRQSNQLALLLMTFIDLNYDAICLSPLYRELALYTD